MFIINVLSSFSFAQNIDLNKGIPRRQLLHRNTI
jgi:hypothetical protein